MINNAIARPFGCSIILYDNLFVELGQQSPSPVNFSLRHTVQSVISLKLVSTR